MRRGYFPAGGFTWNAGQEQFVRNLSIFDALKLRASYGYSGNRNGIGFTRRQLDRRQQTGDVTDIPKPTKYSRNPEQNNSPANNCTGQVANLSSRYPDNGSFLPYARLVARR